MLPRKLSERLFDLTTGKELDQWLDAVAVELGGIAWVPVGKTDNNVHSVEVSSDPGLALVERPINSIDALLDLRHRETGETAISPHEAARKWYGVPSGGLSAMDATVRRSLADNVRVILLESGDASRPTVVVQDTGTGQHPDDFDETLLSLHKTTKRQQPHVMGVYNAGGSASYRFARGTIIVSRLAPGLLDGRQDEVGVSVVRYDPLDPNRDKIGHYVYLLARDESVIRLDVPELPELSHGTYVKLIEYELSRYARAAYEPKSSLWHLFHAALPEPALPFRVIETRAKRFSGMRGDAERRVITGLLHLLQRPGVADYHDEREIDLGDHGSLLLRYFILNPDRDPGAYVRSGQALTLTLNGQRQMIRDRYWVRRQLDLNFIHQRLIVVVDGTGLGAAGRRDVFSSTREHGVDTPLTREILERVVEELREDEGLLALDEEARDKTREKATRKTTEKVKKLLAGEVASLLAGELAGPKGGQKKRKRRKRERRPVPPPAPDDSHLLDIPDSLTILTDPLRIEPGRTAPLRLEINAKNGFLPRHADQLSVVFGPDVSDSLSVRSKGKLLGGRVRITISASEETPLGDSSLQVALVVPKLGIVLTTRGQIEVVESTQKREEKDSKHGGAPNIEVAWVPRDGWDLFTPPWNAENVGMCFVGRDDGLEGQITKVEWWLNEAFDSYEAVVERGKLTERKLETFQEGYQMPVCIGLFRQKLAEEAFAAGNGEEGMQIPDEYLKGEQSRLARAVLLTMQTELSILPEG